MYINASDIHSKGLRTILNERASQINASDIVWCGPSGDAVIASDPAALDEEYADYTDEGQVSEYLD